MTIRFVILMSVGVLILSGICFEISYAVDRRATKKLEEQLEKEEKNGIGI
jgi:Na+/melibiose symporter-like transporter